MMAPGRAAWWTLVPLLLVACAGFHQGEFDDLAFRQRAVVLSDGPVTISAAVPDARETEHITGLDLYDQGIQPVWLEVTNHGDSPVRVALWSIDRDYFSPIEVAYMNRRGRSKAAQDSMQRWFHDTRLHRRVAPGETRSGFVYTHWAEGTKGFLTDVYGSRKAYHFAFFVPMPGFVADYTLVDFETLYTREQIVHLDPEDVMGLYILRQEQTVCCSSDEQGVVGNPLNLVFIGTAAAVRRAMLRANWQEAAAASATTVLARAHRYRGAPTRRHFS